MTDSIQKITEEMLAHHENPLVKLYANRLRAFIEAAPEKGGEPVAYRYKDYQTWLNGGWCWQYADADCRHGIPASAEVESLYAHPAAAKEPGVTEAMVYAFHNALSDGPLGQQDFDDIKTALTAALAHQQGKEG